MVESFPREQVTKADCVNAALASSKDLPLDLAILDLRLPMVMAATSGNCSSNSFYNIQLIVLSGVNLSVRQHCNLLFAQLTKPMLSRPFATASQP